MKSRLMLKIALSLCSFSAIAILALSSVVYFRTAELTEKNISTQIQENSAFILHGIDSAVQNILSQIQGIAHLNVIVTEFEEYNENPILDPALLEKHFRLAITDLTNIGKEQNLHSFGLLSLDGKILAHTNPSAIGRSLAEREYFARVKTEKKAILGDPVVSKISNVAVSVVIVPILSKTDKILGYAYTSIDIGKLGNTIISSIDIGETGGVTVLNKDGLIIMHKNPDYVLKANISDLTSNLDFLGPLKRTLTTGYFGGIEKMIYSDDLISSGWVAVTYIDHAETLAPLVKLRNIIIIWTLIGILITTLGTILIVTPVVRALKDIGFFANALAKNDFSKKLKTTRTDELGQLVKSLVTMKTSIQSFMEEAENEKASAHSKELEAVSALSQAQNAQLEIERNAANTLRATDDAQEVASQISSSANDIAASCGQLAGINLEQQERTTEIAAAIEELTATIADVAQNALSASKSAMNSKDEASNGELVVQNVLHSITAVHSDSERLQESMAALNRQTETIGSVMGVITDIADQTNLLALNAAIEAARAGDAGKGFAVVADEVRKLAERTMQATAEVEENISNIKVVVEQNTTIVNNTAENVNKAAELAKSSGVALANIVSMVGETTMQINSIATAVEEQSAASEEITQRVGEMTILSDKSVANTTAGAVAINSFAEIANKLTHVMDTLKK